MEKGKQFGLAVITCVLALALAPSASGKILYVDSGANGGNDGSSWKNAYTRLQDALVGAKLDAPVEIRVAAGIYKPDEGDDQISGDRGATFQLIDGLALKGGYAGLGRADPNARDIGRYETVLTGDLAGNDVSVSDPCDMLNEPSRTDNSYHVVTASGTEPNAVIEGFTITAGSAEPLIETPEPSYAQRGGGMYVVSGNPTVTNCRFTWNLAGGGGAVYAYDSSPVLSDCTFSNNAAGRVCIIPWVGRDPVVVCSGGHGGAISTVGGSAKISGCTFTRNSATYGGGVYNDDSSPIFEDCLFSANTAYKGGGVHNIRNSPRLVRCTFRANIASGHGGAMANNSVADTELVDSVLVENWAASAGGAIDNSYAELSLVRCTLARNRTPQRGGAMNNWNSEVQLSNCVLCENVAVTSVFGAGAMYNENANMLTLVNCTFVGNSGKYASGFVLLGDRSTMQLTSCIVRNGGREITNENNSTISIAYTNITGGWAGEGNMDVDPCFAAIAYSDPNGTPKDPNDDFWVDGDYHLKSQAGRWDILRKSWVKDQVTSPCIDAGHPNSPLGEEPFPNGGRINMGAYGGTAEASKSYFGEALCQTIIAGDINGDCRVDFVDLAIMASHWSWDPDARPSMPSPDSSPR